LTPLQGLEARLRLGPEREGLKVHLSDDNRAVGKALAALGRLGVPVRRATVLPGVGSSAVLRVQLGRRLAPDQLAALVEPLLTLKCVVRVETTDVLQDDEDQLDDRDDAQQWRGDQPTVLGIDADDPLGDLNDADGDEAEIGTLDRVGAGASPPAPRAR
jgi:putative Mg2+ transporter-C (MgtC) family protein